MTDIWKPVPGYEGLYEISNNLEVRSLVKNRVLRQYTLVRHGLPYRFVCLSKDRKKRTVYIHRAAALAFIPNPQNKEQVDHIDGNSLNNSVSNLRWVTCKENCNNPVTIQRQRLRHNGKPVVKVDKQGRTIERYVSIRDAARGNNISLSAILYALKNNEGKTNGMLFRKETE